MTQMFFKLYDENTKLAVELLKIYIGLDVPRLTYNYSMQNSITTITGLIQEPQNISP